MLFNDEDEDYLQRVLVPVIQAFERYILNDLTRILGVANIRSSFVLKQVRYKTSLRLPNKGFLFQSN